MTPANPHEAAARAEKVARIADVVWASMTTEKRRDPEYPDRLAAASEEYRCLAAKYASTPDLQHGPPSDETWDGVVRAIRRKQRLETADPFERIERHQRAADERVRAALR